MGEWLASVGPAVGNHLWQSTAFAVAAWVVTLLLRRNQARVRYGVWLAASLKFLLPFSLLIALGGMLPRPQRAVVTMPVYSAVDEVGMPFSDLETVPMAALDPTHAAMRPRHEWGTRLMSSLPRVLAGVWVCGVAAVLVVWCVGWLRVKRTLRRAVLAEDGREAEILRRVEEAMGGRRRTRLVLSRELMEPGMFGILRPVLIWPERLSERLDDEHIEAILAHELMHARRRDNLTASLHMVVEAAFWFHPLVWWMERRMVEERERACDEAVVAMGSRPGVYAESLLKACRFCVESPLVCVAGITGADLAARVRAIMTLRLERLGFGRKVMLAAFGVAAIAGPVTFGVVRMIPMYGQVLHATGPLPSFEAATIKPSDPERRGKGFTTNGRHFSTLNTTASDLLQYAYGIQTSQIVDAPAWLDVNQYDITAVANEGDANDPKWNLMMRKLLADRFGLTFHRDTKELPVYELRIGKNGPKLAKTDTDPDRSELYFSRTSKSGAGISLHAKAATMAGLASLLQVGLLERPVVDRTGLAGTFDFNLDFTADTVKGGDASALNADMNAPAGIFTAIQEQLGLKLAAAKGPTEVIVIDHVEKPVFDEADEAAKSSIVATAVAAGERLLGSLVPAALVQEKGTPSDSTTEEARLFKFDVVSIRPAEPEADGRKSRTGFQYSDDGFVAMNQTLLVTLLRQYQTELSDSSRIVGGPDWVRTNHWDIRAKVADSDIAQWSKLGHDSISASKEQRRAVEAMLAERFKLKTHIETREGTIYALVVAKGGPKLKASTSDLPPRMVSWQGHVSFERTTVRAMLPLLMQELGYPVIDKTGVTGVYDITLYWALPPGMTGAPGGDAGQPSTPSDVSAPSLFTAVQEQLGLKLEAQKGPIETLVIDSAEKPSVDGAEVDPTHRDVAAMNGAPAPGASAAAKLPEMRFEVATIKPCPPGYLHRYFYLPGGTAENFGAGMATVESMIGFAYDIPYALGMGPGDMYMPPSPDLIGGPEWVHTDRYDLAAKADAATVAAWSKLPEEQQDEELRSMMRALLAERFHLTMRHETREMPVWALVVAKGGPKFKISAGLPADVNEPGDEGYDESKPYKSRLKLGAGLFQGQDIALDSLVYDLWAHRRELEGRKILDRTGLTGAYDLNLKWAPEGDPADTGGPSLFTAIQEQLGLKLESTKAPVDVLAIDHIERPSEN